MTIFPSENFNQLQNRLTFTIMRILLNSHFKHVGDDNLAFFYTFSSEVSEKPGFRNNYFLFQICSSTLKKVGSTLIPCIRSFDSSDNR
jgi:hypothetical protein